MGHSYNQLTLSERNQIQALNELKYSARKIADKIRRSNKTVSVEFKRCPPDGYCAEAAHRNAQLKRQQARGLLAIGLSPEQVSGRMKLESFAGASAVRPSTE